MQIMEFECRTCLKLSAKVGNVFSDGLPHKIETIASVEILEDDKFSSKICEECLTNVNQLYEFRKVVRSSNMILMKRCMKEEGAVTSQNEDTIETQLELKEEDISDYYEMENDDDDEVEAPATPNEKAEIFKCGHCDFTSLDYDSWEAHQKRHKKTKQANCKICGKSVISYNLKRHHLIHTESPVNCSICGTVCKHEESLRSHMFTHRNGPYPCTICGKIYRHRQSYNAHKKRHTTGDDNTVECAACGKLFSDKKTLINHIDTRTCEKSFPCKVCDKGFTSNFARNTHERLHTNEKPFSCDHCDEVFSQRVSLQTHLKSKHPNEEIIDLPKDQKKSKIYKQAICSICGKSVISYNIKRHYLIHTESPVTCKTCGKVCKHEESLRAHMYMHNKGPYLCTICGKVYRHRQDYNAHKKRHASGNAKTVECSTCGKLFFKKTTLVRHIYSHTGERPYPCKFCNKGFTSTHARKTHERRHTNEKPFSCDFCDATFPQGVSLRTHLTSKHPDQIIVNKEIAE